MLNGLSEYENQDDDYDEAIRGFKSADHRDIIKNFQSPRKGSPRNHEIIPEVHVKPNRPGSTNS